MLHGDPVRRASRGREWALPIPLWNGEAPLGRRCSDPGQADGWLSLHCGGSVRRTRFEHYRDPGRPRSFDHLARCGAGCFKSRERLAHDPGAAFGQRDQILTQPLDVLLHRQATNFAVTIPEPDTRPVAPKELSLNHQRRVAGPPADPDNTSYGSVPTRNSDQKPERDWNLCSIRALRELGGLARKAATSCGEPVAISSASAPRSRRPQA